MRVIYAIIHRSLDIMKELGIRFMFLEVDQAIYSKVLDAMFKLEKEGSDILDKVIPRMGRFHIVLSLLRTIYSSFKNAGIVELLCSAGLRGVGTFSNALNGGHTREAIHIIKYYLRCYCNTKFKCLRSSTPEAVHELNDIYFCPKLKGNMVQ